MLHTLERAPSTRWLAVATLMGLAVHMLASAWLNASYAESLFPVPYDEAQLSFSADKLKAWYAYLQSKGTLDVYLRTQHIDFVFIASVLWLHAAALLWLSRWFETGTRGRRWLVLAACLSAAAPALDALENGVSYVMLADPQGFAPGLAHLYSGLAAAKFGAFTLTYAAAAVGLVAGVAMALKRAWHGREVSSAVRGTIVR